MQQASYLVTADQGAKEVFGVCLRQFHLLRKKPGFPVARALGPRAIRWVRSELEQYAASLPAATLGEPAAIANARRARAGCPAPFNGALA